MPRPNSNAPADNEPVESDERVDFEEENDPEMDEEVEYEEVEVEEEEEEIEEEVEEEVDEDEEDSTENIDEATTGKSAGNEAMAEDEDEKKKQDQLLALPPHGSEVYVGGIPNDISEEDLKSFCESIGEVTQVRIMKGKDSNENKGFAFVTFRNVDLASTAINELNNAEFKGKRVRCSTSQSKHRLFIGNIPRSWEEDDLRKVVSDVGPGVASIELVKDMKNSNNNRGFAFIEYYNNACAEYSRQKMMNPKFRLGDNAPTVSWADPKNAESSAASQVKAVYVKNLPKNVTQDQLKKLFDHYGKITKIVLPSAKPGQNRIAFIHYAERSSAMKALKNTEKYELDGHLVECSLAKPQADQKNTTVSSLPKPGLLPSFPTNVGFGMVGGAYGALGAGYGVAGFAQPLIYGRGATPAGMSMMPMLLPDGRIGYVLQQPGGGQPHNPPIHQRSGRGGGKGGASSSRGRHNEGGGSGRYRPY